VQYSNAVSVFFAQVPPPSQLSVASAGSGFTVSTGGRKSQLDYLIVLGEKSGIMLELALVADAPFRFPGGEIEQASE